MNSVKNSDFNHSTESSPKVTQQESQTISGNVFTLILDLLDGILELYVTFIFTLLD